MRLFSRRVLTMTNYHMTINLGLSHEMQSHEPNIIQI